MTEPNGSPSDSDSFVIVDFMEKDDQTAKSDTIQVEPNEKTSQEAANFSITTDYFGMKKDDDTSNRSDLDNQDSLDVDITSTSDPSPTNPFDTDPSLGGIAESNRQELSPNNSNHSLLDGFESDANSPFAKPVKRVQQPARKRTAPTQSKKKDNPLDGFAKTPDPTISQDDDLENAVFNNLPGMNQGSPVTSPTRQESFPSPLTSPSASNTQTNLFSSNSLRDVDCHIIVSKPTLVRDPTPDNIFATPTPTASANAVDNPFEGFEASTNSLVSETFQQIPSADSEPLEGFEDTFIGLATTPDNSLTKKFEVEVPANDLSPDNQKVEQLANLNPVVTENLDDSGPEVLTVASDSDNPFEASSEIVGNTCENPPISTQTSTTRTSDNPFTGFGDSSAAMTHNTTASENPFGDISAGTSSDQPPDNGASDNPFANIADLSKPEQSETPKSPISDSADASNALDNTTASDNPFGDVLDGISSDQSPDNGASDNPFTNIADLSKPEQSETPKSPISDSADASNALNVNPFSSEKRPEITEQSERTDAENPFVVSAEDSADASNAVEVNPFAFENTPAAKIEQSESTVEESNSFAASKNSDFLDMFGSLTHQPANDMHAETKAENPEKAETRKEPPLDPFADLLAPTQNAPVQDDIFGDLMAKSAEPPVKNLEPDKNQSDLGFEDLVGGAESSLKKDEVGVDIIPSEKFSDPIEKSQDDNVGFGDFAEAEPQKKEHSQNDAFGSGDSTAQPDNNVPADGFALESAKSEEPSQTDDFGFGDLASELKPVQKAEVPENDDFATKPVEKASSNDDFGFGDFSPVQEQAENMDAIETAEPINNDVAEQPDDFGFGDADDQFGVKKTSAADDFGGFGDFAETSEKPAEQEHAKDDCAFGDEDLKKEDNAAKVGPEEVQQTCGADEFGFGDFPEQSEKPAKADSFEDDFGFGDQEQLEIQTADVEQTSVRDEFGSGGFPEQSERPAQAEPVDDAFGFENQEQTKPDLSAEVENADAQQTSDTGDFGFGDFPEESEKLAEPESASANDGFGFGDEEQLKPDISDAPPPKEVDLSEDPVAADFEVDDGGFGHFDEAGFDDTTPEMTPEKRPKDDFGDFGDNGTTFDPSTKKEEITQEPQETNDVATFAENNYTKEDATKPAEDDFGDFGDFPEEAPQKQASPKPDDFGDFGDDGFGDFPEKTPVKMEETAKKDDFGDFGDDDFGDFGDFNEPNRHKESSGNDDFGDFGDDDFGDFGAENQDAFAAANEDDFGFGDFGDDETSFATTQSEFTDSTAQPDEPSQKGVQSVLPKSLEDLRQFVTDTLQLELIESQSLEVPNLPRKHVGVTIVEREPMRWEGGGLQKLWFARLGFKVPPKRKKRKRKPQVQEEEEEIVARPPKPAPMKQKPVEDPFSMFNQSKNVNPPTQSNSTPTQPNSTSTQNNASAANILDIFGFNTPPQEKSVPAGDELLNQTLFGIGLSASKAKSNEDRVSDIITSLPDLSWVSRLFEASSHQNGFVRRRGGSTDI